MARVIHFEIPSDDPEKSLEFYQKVFGWQTYQWNNEPYWLCSTGEQSKPGINGAIMKRRTPEQPVVNTIDVEDIDQAIKTIEANGGVIVAPKMAVPGIGRLVYFKDPDGNIMGALQEDKNAK